MGVIAVVTPLWAAMCLGRALDRLVDPARRAEFVVTTANPGDLIWDALWKPMGWALAPAVVAVAAFLLSPFVAGGPDGNERVYKMLPYLLPAFIGSVSGSATMLGVARRACIRGSVLRVADAQFRSVGVGLLSIVAQGVVIVVAALPSLGICGPYFTPSTELLFMASFLLVPCASTVLMLNAWSRLGKSYLLTDQAAG